MRIGAKHRTINQIHHDSNIITRIYNKHDLKNDGEQEEEDKVLRRGQEGRNPREMKARHRVRNGGAGEMYFPRESHGNEDGRDQEEQTEHFCRQRPNRFIQRKGVIS